MILFDLDQLSSLCRAFPDTVTDDSGLRRRFDKPAAQLLACADRGRGCRQKIARVRDITAGPRPGDRTPSVFDTLQEFIQLRPWPGLRNDLLPPLVPLLSQQESRKVRHLDPLGLGPLLADSEALFVSPRSCMARFSRAKRNVQAMQVRSEPRDWRKRSGRTRSDQSLVSGLRTLLLGRAEQVARR